MAAATPQTTPSTTPASPQRKAELPLTNHLPMGNLALWPRRQHRRLAAIKELNNAHSLPDDVNCAHFGIHSKGGLEPAEIEKCQRDFGPNQLTGPTRAPALVNLARQVFIALNLVLIAPSSLALLLWRRSKVPSVNGLGIEESALTGAALSLRPRSPLAVQWVQSSPRPTTLKPVTSAAQTGSDSLPLVEVLMPKNADQDASVTTISV
ncbi:hypothetical protein A4X13_0g5878 [Tilletia indica]|uniref:Cation-transporting P-type ATPase N-terminal domain-containing protein n=1 Tax=Tilletia indica TaxID=43049 RepID=A0A8T8SQT7_9BASI|nr:hypothetical protein A4X13_0g5878 [Tilletia indica]